MKNIYICTYKANYDIKLHNKEIKEGQIFTKPKDDCLKRLMHQGKITKLSCNLVRSKNKFETHHIIF